MTARLVDYEMTRQGTGQDTYCGGKEPNVWRVFVCRIALGGWWLAEAREASAAHPAQGVRGMCGFYHLVPRSCPVTTKLNRPRPAPP